MENPPAYPHQTPYQPGPPAPPPQQKKGFPVWAIVLLVLLGLGSVLGITLVTLGIYGARRFIAASKTAEAKNSIGAISRDAVAAYESEQFGAEPGGGANSITHRLCGSASPVPASIASVKGLKYMPSSTPGTDFNSGDAQNGWQCLKFSMSMPMYYRYQYHKGSGYLVPSIAPGRDGFEASAQGDLDADGTLSTFARTGTVGPNDTIVLATTIYTENEME
jgi:type IV pilus assembly protein PilA